MLCEIESDLSTADESKFKEKNKHFWNLGKHYLKVDYDVKVLIGPADVRFELCKCLYLVTDNEQNAHNNVSGFNGQKLSKDKPIKVEWMPAPAIELPAPPVVPEAELGEAVLSTQTSSTKFSNGPGSPRDSGY